MPRWRTLEASLGSLAALIAAALACSGPIASRPVPPFPAIPAPAPTVTTAPPSPAARAARGPRDASTRIVRIVLAEGQREVQLSSARGWRIHDASGQGDVALTQAGERWLLQRDGRGISARRSDSQPVNARETTVIARPDDPGGTIEFNGKRWRGELVVTASGDGLLVVNRVVMDDYLRGVVPLEIGTSAATDVAAVEAQAITARSYAVTHLAGAGRPFDMRATVQDQVYGGVGAETRVANLAIDATSGLVLLYDGRVVNAPYHANCGGNTADPADSWRAEPEPYLKRVSDQIPGTTRFYCDQAPRFRWTRVFTGDELRQSVERYVRALPGAGSGVGSVRAVRVVDVTPAGRVGTLAVESDRGSWLLRGNQIRSALRSTSGDLLYSTYFSVDVVSGRDGVERLSLHGGGNGHGVGMCQSGAIGRARAGQDARTILATYYPGTTVGPIE